MKYTEPTPEDYEQIAEKVRSGEYFREARAMIDVMLHNPMAERYFYLMVTAAAFMTFLGAFIAMNGLYPLSRTVPFAYSIYDVLEDVPTIMPLRTNHEQDVDEAVLLFLSKQYLLQYEGYSIDTIERNLNGVQHYSSPEVFAQYQILLQTSNPESPVMKYQRHSVRKIEVLATRLLPAPEPTLEINYEASVENAEGATKSRHRATITYSYSGIEIDEKTGTVKPLQFLVKRYRSQPIEG